MMFGGGPQGRMFQRETLKPKRVGETLGRLARYFAPFWSALLGVALLIVVGTYTQVRSPELIGQSVDCYLTPAVAARFASDLGGAGGGAATPNAGPSAAAAGAARAAGSNCWYASVGPNPSSADLVRGLGMLLLTVAGLYVIGSLCAGLQFFLMSWAGQHVLRNLRTQTFRHLHDLSLGYYSRNEAGAVMSRVTNDTDTLQQTLNFALVNVTSGALLITWILVKMLSLSVPYALVSMVVLPLMFLVTLYLSAQA